MQIVDSYSESNASINWQTYTNSFVAQSFTGDGGNLSKIKIYGRRRGVPTGNVYAKIYTHSGTFGTNSMPTGSALATSDPINIMTIGQYPSVDPYLIAFTFSEENKIALVDQTKYCFSIEFASGDFSNNLWVMYDVNSPSHAGNISYFVDTWQPYSTSDLIFYVYNDNPLGPFPTHLRI